MIADDGRLYVRWTVGIYITRCHGTYDGETTLCARLIPWGRAGVTVTISPKANGALCRKCIQMDAWYMS